MLRTSPSTARCDFAREDISPTCSDYLLVCQASSRSLNEGSWHFTLETADGSPVFSAGDEDSGDLNRLTLLAAVRGLESIDGASAVTLLSNNRYLIRSLSDSLPRWRENDFVWEHFGRRIDVQHADLWRRVDRALSIHRVEACLISSRLVSGGNARPKRGDPEPQAGDSIVRVDSPHRSPAGPKLRTASEPTDQLRRWLLGGGASDGSATPPRRRFTVADLMETA
jgi:ribonuclease HI